MWPTQNGSGTLKKSHTYLVDPKPSALKTHETENWALATGSLPLNAPHPDPITYWCLRGSRGVNVGIIIGVYMGMIQGLLY